MAAFGSVDVAVKFLADASSVKDEASKIDGIGKTIKHAALGIGGAIAGAFAVDQVMDFVGAAEEAEVASNRLSKTLENAGDVTGDWWRHAEDLSESLMNQTGIDDEIIKGGQAILATFHGVSGAVGQTSGAFDRATQLALDMSKTGFGDVNSSATMLGKALEDPIKGITALGRVGITFSADQKKAIEALVDSGDKAGAMGLILDNVQGQVGGVAAATATSSDKMSVAWGEVQESIGAALLPIFDRMRPAIQAASEWIQTSLVPAIASLSQWIYSNVIPAIISFVGWLRDKLGPVFAAIVGWLRDSLIPAITRLGEWFAENKGEIAAYFEPFLNALRTLWNLVKVVAPVIGTLAVHFAELAVVIGQKLGPPLQALGSWISDNKEIFPAIAIAIGVMLIPALISFAVTVWTQVIPAFIVWAINAAIAAAATIAAAAPFILLGAAIAAFAFLIIKNWDTIKAVTLAVFDAVKNAVMTAFNWIRDNWPLLLAIITGPIGIAVLLIQRNLDTILGFFRAIPGAIASALSTLGGIIVAPFQWAWDQIVRIKDGIVNTFGAAVQGAKDIWNAFARFWNGINVTVGGQDPLGPFGPSIPEVTLRLPHIPELAQGGIVTGRTLAMLGERGPEAVVPLNRLGGNITINITTTGLGADAPAIQRAVVSALRGYVTRNGPIAGVAG